VYSGYLRKKTGTYSQWWTRWFVLAAGHLAYWEDKKDVAQKVCKGVIHVHHIPMATAAASSLAFELSVEGKQKVELISERYRDKVGWMQAIRKADTFYANSTSLMEVTDGQHVEWCEWCGHVDLDRFTLARIDGLLHISMADKNDKKEQPGTFWAVFAPDHFAWFRAAEYVSRYEPVRLVHVHGDGVKAHPSKDDTFVISTRSGFVLNCTTASRSDCQEWIHAMATPSSVAQVIMNKNS